MASSVRRVVSMVRRVVAFDIRWYIAIVKGKCEGAG